MAQEPYGYANWAPAPMKNIHEEHVLIPGQWISGNLWHLPLRHEVLEEAGPVGSLMRHTTTMASPSVLHCVQMGLFPPRNLANPWAQGWYDMQANGIAAEHCADCLHCRRLWSNKACVGHLAQRRIAGNMEHIF